MARAPGPGPGLQLWLEHSGADPSEVMRRVQLELDELLGMDLCAQPLDLAPQGVRALVEFLAPDRRRPVESLAEALAEILLVPRRRRTEYLRHHSPAGPWDIRRLLLEYALWSARVDRLQDELTKEFCATHCRRPLFATQSGRQVPVGCCSVLGYDMGLVTNGMRKAQHLEARAAGWTPPAVEEYCKYLGPAGCVLRLFKSPVCAGMLCDELVQHLRGRHEARAVDAFLERLALFRNHVLDREDIFSRLAEVVSAGEALR